MDPSDATFGQWILAAWLVFATVGWLDERGKRKHLEREIADYARQLNYMREKIEGLEKEKEDNVGR